ncbi:hypothetical protein A2282_02365 [candidate division WOR-1 bacterium RIFOXYA12_FULL_36_13]|nr:MAG: hypothetical protein A2282_02365 [candidate division WOR-1 bacterium RIFOXYA12_FULL_36_13]
MNKKNKKFVGYFPKINIDINDLKIPNTNKKWITEKTIIEIASVSNCMRKGPDIPQGSNELGFYDNEILALSSIQNETNRYTMFAYTLFLFCYEDGNLIEKSKMINKAKKLKAVFVPERYKLIGYDVTSNSLSDFFECSPLSCNQGFKEFKTNKYCLFNEIDYAVECQKIISSSNFEPGKQYLFEVYKKTD